MNVGSISFAVNLSSLISKAVSLTLAVVLNLAPIPPAPANKNNVGASCATVLAKPFSKNSFCNAGMLMAVAVTPTAPAAKGETKANAPKPAASGIAPFAFLVPKINSVPKAAAPPAINCLCSLAVFPISAVCCNLSRSMSVIGASLKPISFNPPALISAPVPNIEGHAIFCSAKIIVSCIDGFLTGKKSVSFIIGVVVWVIPLMYVLACRSIVFNALCNISCFLNVSCFLLSVSAALNFSNAAAVIISFNGRCDKIPYLDVSNCLAISPFGVANFAASLSLSNFSCAFFLSAAVLISSAVGGLYVGANIPV